MKALLDDDGFLVSARCESGEMELSSALLGLLDRAFFGGDPPDSCPPLMASSQWFCPRDGDVLWQSGASSYTCPTCGRHLDPTMVWHLVELHPHQG